MDCRVSGDHGRHERDGLHVPSEQFTPARVVGVISLVALAAALFGLYYARLAGAWRWIYVSGAVMALYLNVFVAVVQGFQKLAFLHPLAPTGSEPPFVVTQVLVLAAFIWAAVLALRRFHPSCALRWQLRNLTRVSRGGRMITPAPRKSAIGQDAGDD